MTQALVYCVSGTVVFSSFFLCISIHSLIYFENLEHSISWHNPSFPTFCGIKVSLTWTQTNNVIERYHWLPAGVTDFSSIATIYLVLCRQQLLVKGYMSPMHCSAWKKKASLPNQHSSPVCVYHKSRLASFLAVKFPTNIPLHPLGGGLLVLSGTHAPPIVHCRHCETKGSSCHMTGEIPHI